MEADVIISKLKTSPYKFTQANKFRDMIKSMDDEDQKENLIFKLKKAMADKSNSDVWKPLGEILFNIN